MRLRARKQGAGHLSTHLQLHTVRSLFVTTRAALLLYPSLTLTLHWITQSTLPNIYLLILSISILTPTNCKKTPPPQQQQQLLLLLQQCYRFIYQRLQQTRLSLLGCQFRMRPRQLPKLRGVYSPRLAAGGNRLTRTHHYLTRTHQIICLADPTI